MERLVDTTLTATSYVPDAQSGTLPSHIGTVIIGSGIIGAATAYHLAAAGHSDVLLLDRNTVTSGTTWHAAGLCSSVRTTAALTDLATYGISEYSRLQADSGIDVSFNQCGSLLLARTPGRMDELRYTAAVARLKNIPVELLSPDQVAQRWPLASTDGLEGGLFQPQDGHVNPGHAALAYVKLAHELGVSVRENVAVNDILHADGRVTGVRTTAGDMECDHVVLAAGLWSRDLAATAGVSLPLYAAEHVHVRTDPVPGAVPELPVLRDMDGYLYVRHENGCLLVGAFEPDGNPRGVNEVDAHCMTDRPTGDTTSRTISHPTGHAQFPADWEHFAPVRALAEQRVPALRAATYERFLNAPESFTPDSNFLLGQTAELTGLFVGAGFNSQGITYGPGAGRALADWVINGVPGFDANAVDVRRFSPTQSNRRYLHERTKEGLGRVYSMHWPQLQPRTARNVRRSPLHDRLATAGACFGEADAWERANWFAPPGVEPVYAYSYGRQNWFDYTGDEHRAAREAAALFDLSSFTKVEIAGPDAVDVLQRFCTANVDLSVGRLRYTLMLNAAGRIELDGTVVRLDAERFWVITPATTQKKTLGMLTALARGRHAAVFDATAGFATIAIMGPSSRDIVQRISPDDWSNDAQPFGAARTVEIADGSALSLRLSYVGELGYELYPSADQAVNLYDALMAAGRDLGLVNAGYHALDSLRVEKGYRHLGHDIGVADDPVEAALGFTVSWKKDVPFTGRAALEPLRGQARSRRAVHIALCDPEPIFVHDEPVLRDGRVVGRVSSGNYGYTLGRACGLAYVDGEVPASTGYQVDCGGTVWDAEISDTPFFDPQNLRMKG